MNSVWLFVPPTQRARCIGNSSCIRKLLKEIVFPTSFNHKTVWTAVAHLYRPTDVIDEKVDLLELTVLADMLGLHQLLDTVIATITSKHCHNFHKVNLLNVFGKKHQPIKSILPLRFAALPGMHRRRVPDVAAVVYLQPDGLERPLLWLAGQIFLQNLELETIRRTEPLAAAPVLTVHHRFHGNSKRSTSRRSQ